MFLSQRSFPLSFQRAVIYFCYEIVRGSVLLEEAVEALEAAEEARALCRAQRSRTGEAEALRGTPRFAPTESPRSC